MGGIGNGESLWDKGNDRAQVLYGLNTYRFW